MDKSKVTPVMTPTPKEGSSINDLLFLAHAYEENGECGIAKLLYERTSASFQGMLAYSHFLLSNKSCGEISKQDQTKKAESMLMYVAGNSNDEDQIGRACMMLADLYRHTNAVRSLGYYMRANRYGKNTDPNLQTQLLKRVAKMEICKVERDIQACYIVGTEFYKLGHDPMTMKWTMYFLEMVTVSMHCKSDLCSFTDDLNHNGRSFCDIWDFLQHWYVKIWITLGGAISIFLSG